MREVKTLFLGRGEGEGGADFIPPCESQMHTTKKMKHLPYPCKQFLYDFVHQNVLARNKPPCCILSQCFLVNVPNEQ